MKGKEGEENQNQAESREGIGRVWKALILACWGLSA